MSRGLLVAEAYRAAVAALTASRIRTSRLDAEVLLCHTLGLKDRSKLISFASKEMQPQQIFLFEEYVRFFLFIEFYRRLVAA